MRYKETFAGGFGKESLFSLLRSLQKKKISPWLDMNEKVCGGTGYYWQPS